LSSLMQLLMISTALVTGCPGPASPTLPYFEEVYFRQKPKAQPQPDNWSLDKILEDDVGDDLIDEPPTIPHKPLQTSWQDFLERCGSESIGKASDGRLTSPRKLPRKGTGFTKKNDKAPYGTDETVALLSWVCDRMTKMYPGTVPLVIGDLSSKKGGRLKPHASHQSGRDIDFGYYFKNNQRLDHFKTASRDLMDVEKTWALLSLLMETGQVQYLFIDKRLHKPLYKHARAIGWSQDELERLFEAPLGKRKRSGIIRHIPGHKHHVHIRFKCPEHDKRCR
jgi:murein endopeptidase